MQEKSGPIFLVIAFGAMLGFVAFLLVGPRDAGDATAAPGTTAPADPDGGGTSAPAGTGSTIAEGSDGSTTTTAGDPCPRHGARLDRWPTVGIRQWSHHLPR